MRNQAATLDAAICFAYSMTTVCYACDHAIPHAVCAAIAAAAYAGKVFRARG